MDYHSFAKDLMYYAHSCQLCSTKLMSLDDAWFWVVVVDERIHFYEVE